MLTADASGPIAPEVIADLKEVTLRVPPRHLLLTLAVYHNFPFLFAPEGEYTYFLNYFLSDAYSCQ